jgi:sulfite exporter TauE/SafE
VKRRAAVRIRALFAAATLSAIAGVPGVSAACAVCFAGTDDASRVAFISTTVFMTLLPLGLLGTAGWWAYRRFQVLDRAAERLRQKRASEAAPPAG